MAKAFYSEYVNHCLRFYARHADPKFRTKADKLNWEACKNAIETFNTEDREILLLIYNGEDSVPNAVSEIARTNNVAPNTMWKLVNDLERKVATYRGLL